MSEQRVVLDLADVEIVSVQDESQRCSATDQTTWPCPACGQRSPLRQAVEATVEQRHGRPMRRQVLLCRTCSNSLPRG